MSDTEIILKLLRNVEWRIRANRLLHELTLGLSVVLMFLVALKVWDLFSPLKAATVIFVIGTCVLAFAGYAVWRLQKKETLVQAAVSVDEKAGMYDEIKTAFWFINNPRSSEWVEMQIQRAAKHARALDLNRTFPSSLPRTSYMVAAMVVLFVGMNFIPLRFNHNWLMLQAAPAYDSPDAAAARRAGILQGLDSMARVLQKSDETKAIGDAILMKELDRAAQELRELAESLNDARIAEIKKILEEASKESRPGLEKLSEALAEAAEAVNPDDFKSDLEKAAEEFEKIAADALVENTEEQQLEKDPEETGTAKGSQTDLEPGEDPTNGRESESGETAPANGKENPNGVGKGGGKVSTKPREVAVAVPTTALTDKLEMDVKLELKALLAHESLKNVANPGNTPEEKEEAATKPERSRVEYHDVQAQLSAAQKDLLTEDSVPWQYRPLIKGYFQAIRPQVNK